MVNVAGAQTERRSGAGPVRVLLRGGRSPAAFCSFYRTVWQTVLHGGRFAKPSYFLFFFTAISSRASVRKSQAACLVISAGRTRHQLSICLSACSNQRSASVR